MGKPVRNRKPVRPRAATPFDKAPGFIGRLNRFMYPIAGPASLGAGHPEDPYEPPADPQCPVCHTSLSTHAIDRDPVTNRTFLNCPR
ncbi:hypothetical protein [Frondihabitans sp. PhB161]|uniref:hypothetical protein n=1 Tax=Frondihabitans sp. PhB161 TaxID=2485193 RepID=UPI0011CE9DE7|nr:hypothetical protein [Frondihabitans sp. PhB161]